jgi:drug/metabolite transporter (DMT)-like permease
LQLTQQHEGPGSYLNPIIQNLKFKIDNQLSKKDPSSIPGFFITFACAILFSMKAIIVKKAFANTSVDASTLLTLRMIFSLPFYLTAAFIVSTKETNMKLTDKQWMYILLLGIFGYYLSNRESRY